MIRGNKFTHRDYEGCEIEVLKGGSGGLLITATSKTGKRFIIVSLTELRAKELRKFLNEEEQS